MSAPIPIKFKLTDAGRLAALDAFNSGLNLKLTQIAIGSGKYNSENLGAGRTALQNEIARYSVSGGSIEPVSRTLRFSAILESGVTQKAFEVGLFDEHGVLFAVASTTANDPLILVTANIAFVAAFSMVLTDVNVTNLTVVDDPSSPLAIALMNQHVAHSDPHPQYATVSRINSFLATLAQSIWHVGSWHGTDNLNWNPRTGLQPFFGYLTNWELRPFAPCGVTSTNDALLQQFGIAGTEGKKASTTRIWSRLPDDFNATITTNRTIAFQRDEIVFTITADYVPDGTVVNYQLVGSGISVNDFRETQISNKLTGQIVFYNNKAQVTVTPNYNSAVNGVFYSDDSFEDVEYVKLRLPSINLDSAPVTIPVVYAGLSQIHCIANGGAASTHFVVATRGIPEGTECTVTCDLGAITETFTLDNTGRHIVQIPLVNEFPFDNDVRSFGCTLNIMDKVYYDEGVLYRIDSGQTVMELVHPVVPMGSAEYTGSYGRVNPADDREFSLRGYSAGNSISNNQESRATLNGLSYATAGLSGTDLKVTTINQGSGISKNRFGVLLIGTEEDTGGLFKPFAAYARVLVYKG